MGNPGGWYGIMPVMQVEAAVPGFPYALKAKTTPGARVSWVDEHVLRLAIPPGSAGQYRLAQLDDYDGLPRRGFPWRAPVRLALRARASARVIPGTWGFGFWNDPFSMALAGGIERLRFPALPNAAWFFFASPPNHLSLREELPGSGNLAAVFRSPRIPAPLLAPGVAALPLLYIPAARRLLRRLGSGIVRQAAVDLPLDPTAWHAYRIDLEPGKIACYVDGQCVLESRLAPLGRLGLVLWVDNQYAALPANGRPGFGTLAHGEEAWIELAGIQIEPSRSA